MSIIDRDSCCSSGVRQDKGRHPQDGTFYAFWLEMILGSLGH